MSSWNSVSTSTFFICNTIAIQRIRVRANLNTRISYIKAFVHRMQKNIFCCPMPFLSNPRSIFIFLVERSIILDISNRIGDASATAATTIYPKGNFSRSREKNSILYQRQKRSTEDYPATKFTAKTIIQKFNIRSHS